MAESMAEHDELVVADLPEQKQQYVCIEFPGIVDNVDKAISCLGGINAISKAHHEKNRRLEMRFRPDDQYCKPTVARAEKVSNLILKVKRRKKKSVTNGDTKDINAMDVGSDSVRGDGVRGDSGEGYEYSTELLGVVNTSFRFPGMTDFQVLPPGLRDIKYKGMPVDPTDFQLKEPLDEKYPDRDIPSFLPPTLFSKWDKPASYGLRPDAKSVKSGGKPEEGTSVSGTKMRPKRMYNTYGITFDFKGSIPTEHHPDAASAPLLNHPKLQDLRKLFEERTVWSRPALQWKLKLPPSQLRSLLSLVAYKFSTGPYKNLWVKFGYDPRLDPASKIYQSIDIRVPKETALVESQSSRTYSRKAGLSLNSAPDVSELTGNDDEELPEGQTASTAETMDETSFMFLPDKIPTQRQIHYQLCDLHEEELQAMVHCNDGQETECTESNGWCEENTYTKLRKAMTVIIKKTAERIKREKQEKMEGIEMRQKKGELEQSDNVSEPMES